MHRAGRRFWGEASARQRSEWTGHARAFGQCGKVSEVVGRAYLPRRLASFAHGHTTGNPRRVEPAARPPTPGIGRRACPCASSASVGSVVDMPSDDVSAPIRASRGFGPPAALARNARVDVDAAGDAAVAVPRNVAPSTVTRDTLSRCVQTRPGVVSDYFARVLVIPTRHLTRANRANVSVVES